jgi:site-specific DNA recombinase
MTLRPADYARFSNDELQDERSIPDQQRLCQATADRIAPGAGPLRHFTDAGISGASMVGRPGLQGLLRAVANGELDMVIAESLDRLSRNQADIARIYQLLTYAGVRLVTVEEGEIDEMAIGFKGTMNALFLKALALKTRRGLLGQVERGRMAGGLSYGYRVKSRGEWEIVPEEAAVIVRIFRLYADGVSPITIAKILNGEGVPGPDGSAWSDTTIHGWEERGTGFLNNELYIGVYVWPKQRFVKNPETGKRIARPVPDDQRGRYPRPHLRIVDDDLWEAVKRQQAMKRRTMKVSIGRGRKPPFLFSGLTKCATCGKGFTVHARDELRCFGHRRNSCSNTRMIKRQELEARVLSALQERFLADPEAFAAFCEGFTEELNRLRREHRAKLAAAPRELAAINRRSENIKELLLEGFRDSAWKLELAQIERRRAELEATIAAAEAEPVLPALHPHMATVYRQKVERLAAALAHEDEDQREAARSSLRGFIDRIVIPPGDGKLMVLGDLGRMLATAAGERDGATLAAVVEDGCGGGI